MDPGTMYLIAGSTTLTFLKLIPPPCCYPDPNFSISGSGEPYDWICKAALSTTNLDRGQGFCTIHTTAALPPTFLTFLQIATQFSVSDLHQIKYAIFWLIETQNICKTYLIFMTFLFDHFRAHSIRFIKKKKSKNKIFEECI